MYAYTYTPEFTVLRINVLSSYISNFSLPISFLKAYKDPASTEDGLYNQLKESKLKMIPSEAIE